MIMTAHIIGFVDCAIRNCLFSSPLKKVCFADDSLSVKFFINFSFLLSDYQLSELATNDNIGRPLLCGCVPIKGIIIPSDRRKILYEYC
jgi:hypothetical protein